MATRTLTTNNTKARSMLCAAKAIHVFLWSICPLYQFIVTFPWPNSEPEASSRAKSKLMAKKSNFSRACFLLAHVIKWRYFEDSPKGRAWFSFCVLVKFQVCLYGREEAVKKRYPSLPQSLTLPTHTKPKYLENISQGQSKKTTHGNFLPGIYIILFF